MLKKKFLHPHNYGKGRKQTFCSLSATQNALFVKKISPSTTRRNISSIISFRMVQTAQPKPFSTRTTWQIGSFRPGKPTPVHSPLSNQHKLSSFSTLHRMNSNFVLGTRKTTLNPMLSHFSNQIHPLLPSPKSKSVFPQQQKVQPFYAGRTREWRDSAYTSDEILNRSFNGNLVRLVTAYRRYGHLTANLDPLQLKQLAPPVELELARYNLQDRLRQKFDLEGIVDIQGRSTATLKEILQFLQTAYSKNIGAEFTYIKTTEERRWIANAVEKLPLLELSTEDRLRTFELMLESESLDLFLQKKFPGFKRYGCEGTEAMLPLLNSIFATAAARGCTDIVIGMPHRGRLNFLISLLQYPARNLFWKIKGQPEWDTETYEGTGDVASHLGQSIDLKFNDNLIHLSLIENPSHLEVGNSVAQGKARCKQKDKVDEPIKNTLPVLIHGDAAFYGQGSVSETLALSQLPAFSLGGTIHLIINNQIGFTTEASLGRSSEYSADLVKTIDAPALHVNADFPEDVVKLGALVVDYRNQFKKDIILDLIGYRRRGHNELDEPSFTQPIMYDVIKQHPSVVKLYGTQLEHQGILSREKISEMKRIFEEKLQSEYDQAGPIKDTKIFDQKWQGLKQAKDCTEPIQTGYNLEKLKEIGRKSVDVRGLTVHSRLTRNFINTRLELIETGTIDWATGEAFAFGSLLADGHDIRLCGQDVGRGTFSQRHMELHDANTGEIMVPLSHLSENQGQIEIVNSPLSELSVLAYEYGYSTENPNTLVAWEAQFGDFTNGAQVIVDQFVSSGEAKWLTQSGITMMLPHGFDGAGPEHSSCRIERFLQLGNADSLDLNNPINKKPNMFIVNPTTPANFFHALRRQMKAPYRKPMIVVGPKKILRLPQARSPLSDFADDKTLEPVIGDPVIDPKEARRVIFCSGKVAYELIEARERVDDRTTAIIRLEQLLPFPIQEIQQQLQKYSNGPELIWFQEEGQNAGAWSYVSFFFASMNTPLKYIGRGPSAVPAVGVGIFHQAEVKSIFKQVFPE